jgi:hypothetical protein
MNSNKENPNKEENAAVPFEVTAEGSLGLLALGAAGISAWRKKRTEEKIKLAKKLKNE